MQNPKARGENTHRRQCFRGQGGLKVDKMGRRGAARGFLDFSWGFGGTWLPRAVKHLRGGVRVRAEGRWGCGAHDHFMRVPFWYPSGLGGYRLVSV